MNNGELFGLGAAGTVMSATGTALQTNDVLQTISLIITIVGALISMIIIPLTNWYRRVKADGKIDKEEIKEGIDTAIKGIEDVSKVVKDNIDKTEKK